MSNFKDCFEALKKFKEKQTLQKMRGLNDYNMVNVVRKESHEVGMHSNVIYSLIDPEGLHYQGDLFLNKFIEKVLKLTNFGNILSVKAEEITTSLNKNKRIDFTIKSDRFYVGIEMKIDHYDSSNQLFDYYQDLKEKAKNDGISEENVLIYYLSKYGKKADLKSSNGIRYYRISFEKDILGWIEACQDEVSNITNLNEALQNYKSIVQKVTKKYNSKVLKMEDFLSEGDNIKYLEEVFKIKNSVHQILGNTLFSLFQNLDKTFNYKITNDELLNKQENVYTKTKCINWFYNNESSLKGLQKTECIGSFYKLSDNIFLRVEVATHNLHIGLVSYEMSDGKYKIVKPNFKLKQIADKYNFLEYRDWRWAKWYSIDCGSFIDLNDKNKECYKNFEHCFLKEKIDSLINVVKGDS